MPVLATRRRDLVIPERFIGGHPRRTSAFPSGRVLCGLAVCALLITAPRRSRAGDWPQILGVERSGVAVDEPAPERLPDTARPLWTLPLGQGYAGPAVVGETVVIFHRVGAHDRVQAVDKQRGTVRWQRDFDAHYRGGIDPDIGPRCVPVVAGETIIAYSAGGVLHAVRLTDGKALWSRDLIEDFGGTDGYFGAGSAPLVVGERVLVNAGGREGSGLVALDLRTGTTRWQTSDEAASYASPQRLPGTGRPRVVFVTRLNALLVDPESGTVLASRPFGRSGPTVNAATPVAFDDYVFLTASYRVGATLLRLEGDRWREQWSNDESLSSQYNTPVYADGHLYGIHGREDVGVAELRCIEAKTGHVVWREPNFGVAHLTRVDNRLLILKVDGTLVLAEASPREFRVLGQLQVSTDTTRALPALSDGLFIFRDNRGQGGQLVAIAL